MIRIQVHSANTTPTAAAAAVKDRILADIAAGRLAPTGANLCFLLQGWGHNQITTTIPANSPVRFFREEDRLPGIVDDDVLPFTSNTDPNNPSRTYRHPWLINATASDAPLKLWTEQFVAAYIALQVTYPALPTPSRMYFDSEEYIAYPRNRQGVWLLNHVAGTSLWNQPVPGWGGQTAAQLYAAAFPRSLGWPADIRNTAAGGIDTALPAQDAVNRPYLAWWCEVVQRSADQVLAHSAYGPIKAQWPDCKVGNYGMSRLDGEEDTTGWFYARDCPDESCSTRSLKDSFTRSWIDRQPWGAELFTEPTARWIAFPEWSSGDVDSPYLYPISLCQWDAAYCTNGGSPGHKLPNAYRGGVDEDRWASSLRLDRHSAESAINSYGGGHEGRLSAWVPMVLGSLESPIVVEWEILPLYMMLRGKNVGERLPFSSNWVDREVVAAEWTATISLIERVDTPWIHGYKRLEGDPPAGAPGDSAQELEYTLRVGGLDRETGLTDAGGVTSLMVEFWDVFPSAPHTDVLIFMETRVDAGTTEMNAGQVYAFDFASEDWVAVPRDVPCVNQFSYPLQQNTFARERFRVVAHSSRNYNDPTHPGRMYIKFVHTADGSFTSYYDLVQAVTVTPQGCSFSEEETLQSDLNYDGEPNDLDLAHFVDRWECACAAADMNLDGDVDEDDLAEYVGHYIVE